MAGFADMVLPGPRWAQPVGWHHRLLMAAIHPDDGVALGEARAWLATHDIDIVTFREHRLLAAIIVRFGRRLADLSSYPRLVGLQKMLWTRTMMSVREATPALSAIVASGMRVLVIKGAARMADGGESGRGRVAHDIDIVVRPEDMAPAFDILVKAGWIAASGQSALCLASDIKNVRGINLYRGPFGDIDLHGKPFHAIHASAADDAGFHERAEPRTLAGVAVFVPSPEDRLAISVAHGGLDAHAHSDWLVDMAVTLTTMPVDFEILTSVLERRTLSGPAHVAFDYLARNGGFGIDAGFVDRLRKQALTRPLRLAGELLEARPRTRSGRILQGLRWIIKQGRKRVGRNAAAEATSQNWLRVRRERSLSASAPSPEVARLSWTIDVPQHLAGARRLKIRARLNLVVPPLRRRVELEFNTADRHLGRAHIRNIFRASKLDLWLSGSFDIKPGTQTIMLSARPGRHLRPAAGPDEVARYGALPFTLDSVVLQRG